MSCGVHGTRLSALERGEAGRPIALRDYKADVKAAAGRRATTAVPYWPEDWVINTKAGSAADALMQRVHEDVTGRRPREPDVARSHGQVRPDVSENGRAPFCDLNMQPWDNKGPACTPEPRIDGGTPP